MDSKALIDGLITYLCFLPPLTFHEFAHAWVAWKCGDDTARLQGRVTLNPIAHMEVLGTVVLPLAMVLFGTSIGGGAAFIFGWGKPVPVNINNLNHRRRDDNLVSLAGPFMNLLLAVVLMASAKVGLLLNQFWWVEICAQMASISLVLCFFNLLPIPPLDGSHVLKNAVGMSDELYWRLCQYGFIMVIVAINIPPVSRLVGLLTYGTFGVLRALFGIGF
jgi:Zn-dependent protease